MELWSSVLNRLVEPMVPDTGGMGEGAGGVGECWMDSELMEPWL